MPGSRLLERDESVLVVVDVQPYFFRKEWFAAAENEAAGTALQRIAWLVALAVRLEIPVIATEEDPQRNGSTEELVARQFPAGAPVLPKPSFGLAGTPEILAAVRATKRGTAVFVGSETDVCVAQSAIGLQEYGFACVVVDDATFSPGEMHERGLSRLAAAGVARNHAKGVAYEWLRTIDDSRAVLGAPGLPEPGFHL